MATLEFSCVRVCQPRIFMCKGLSTSNSHVSIFVNIEFSRVKVCQPWHQPWIHVCQGLSISNSHVSGFVNFEFSCTRVRQSRFSWAIVRQPWIIMSYCSSTSNYHDQGSSVVCRSIALNLSNVKQMWANAKYITSVFIIDKTYAWKLPILP